VNLADLIKPETPAGTALFLWWEGYHVFSIPSRELRPTADRVRFFGVGGKRQDATESLVNCALREGEEEIGTVISHLETATQTYFLHANGQIESINLVNEAIRPRLILEKRIHSPYGSMAHQDLPYYLVGFNACLSGQPTPQNEIAALLYLNDAHLSLIHQTHDPTIADLLRQGAHLEAQANQSIDPSMILTPHGTARFLIQQIGAESAG
jgi:hypothetical protein